MTKLPEWILRDGKNLAIEELEKLVGPVGQLYKEWRAVADGLIKLKDDAPADKPEKLIKFVLQNLDDHSVTKVLAEIDKDLPAKLSAISADFLNSKWAKLIEPVGELREEYTAPASDDARTADDGTNTGLISVPMPEIAENATPSSGNLDLTFGLSAQSEFHIEAGSVWPFRSDGVEERYVRIGASGGIAGKAGAKLPFQPWGAISADVSADGATWISYFYRPSGDAPDEKLFVSTVPQAVQSLANPFNLQSLANAAQNRGLAGYAFFIKGGVEAKASITLGKDFAIEDLAEVKLGLTASVNFARASEWVLSLRPENGTYHLVMSRMKSSSEGWAAGVDINADISGLAQKLDKALTDAMEKAGPLVEEIKPFLSPGTYALTELKSLMSETVTKLASDETLANAIMQDVGLLLGGKSDNSSAIEEWLMQELSAAIDDVAGGVMTEANNFVGEVLDKVTARLPEIVPDDIEAQGRAKVEELVEKLLGDFEEKTKTLTKNENVAGDLVEEFEAVGVKVDALASKADQALAGVRKLVSTFEEYSQKLHAEVRNAANHQIGLTLRAEYQKWSKSEYELIAEITDVNEGTKALWKQLMLGRVQSLQTMMIDKSQWPTGLAIKGGAVTLSAGSKRALNVTISFAGTEFSYGEIAEGKASVKYSPEDGEVKVDASASASKKSSWFGTTRESNFVSVYDLKAFKDDPGSRSISMAVDLSRGDKNLEQKELRDFLEGLSQNNLITDARCEKAKELLRSALKNAGGGKVSGQVGFATKLSPRQINNLIALGSKAADGSAVHKALFDASFDALLACKLNGGGSLIKSALRKADRATGNKGRQWIYQERKDLPFIDGGGSSRRARERGALWVIEQHVDLSMELPELFSRMNSVYRSMPVGVGDGTWDEERYRKEEQHIAEIAKGWIRLRSNRAFSVSLHPTMLALLRILARLDADYGLDIVAPSEAKAVDAAEALGELPAAENASSLLSLVLKLADGDEVMI